MNATTKAAILAADDHARAVEIITTSNSAPEIIAAASRHTQSPEIMALAFEALQSFWPGFFSDSNALRRQLVEINARAAVVLSPLRLVPCELDEITDGNAYLAATFGQSGVVATVVQGKAGLPKARQYEAIFRIDICRP